jgi:hypothetical protein
MTVCANGPYSGVCRTLGPPDRREKNNNQARPQDKIPPGARLKF